MISRFLGNTEYHWKIVSLSYIRTLPSLTIQSLELLTNKMNLETDLNIKNYILNILTKYDYSKARPFIKNLLATNPIAFLRNIHLFAPEKTQEWKNEIMTLSIENNKDESLQLYIKYISLVDIEKHPPI